MPAITSSRLPFSALAFLAGSYLLFSLPSLTDAWSLMLGLAVILVLLWVLKKSSLVVLFFIMGFAWSAFVTDQRLAKALPQELAAQTLVVAGHIEGLPEREGRVVRFNMNVYRSDTVNGKQVKGRIRVSDYRRQSINPQPGEAWKLLLRVKPVHGFANPAGFDYEKWLFNNKIVATAYIRDQKAGDGKGVSINHRIPGVDKTAYIDHLRLAIAKQIDVSLNGSPLSGIITALATGDRRAISTQQWRVLQKTGTSHLMAISGLHVGMVAAIAFFLFRLFWSNISGLTLRFPAHKAAAIAALFLALFYSLLAGFSLPTQRALLMLALLSIAVISNRHVRTLDILSLTLLLVLMVDPLAILSAGFWLSFSAVAMILYTVLFKRHIQRWEEKRLFKAMRLQWKLSLMMAPLSLLFFQALPLAGPFANIIAIPVVALLIVPLVLLASLLFLIAGPGFLEQHLFQLANSLLQSLWALLEMMAETSEMVNFLPDLSVPALVGLLFCVLMIMLPTGLQLRNLALVGLLVFIYPQHTKTRHGEFRMILLDVGQGLSVIIKTAQHSLLFDTGARFSRKFNAGDAVILPVLKSLSIHALDKLLISHGDNDHSGGSAAVLAGINVHHIMANEEVRLDNLPAGKVTPCTEGQQWVWDGVLFKVLHPQEGTVASGNNASCVLQVSSEYGSLLLPADIEKEAEQEIISRYRGLLKSAILVAPHHGSKTSSSPKFLDAVSPQLILIPAGWMNRYHHPSPVVISRMAERGIAAISTAECGAIDVSFAQDGLTVESFRQQNRKIWDQMDSDQNCLNITIGLPENPDF
jgi:competence protein ComEC